MIKIDDVIIAVKTLPDGNKWRVYWSEVFDIKGRDLFRIEKKKDFSDWSAANSFYQQKKRRMR